MGCGCSKGGKRNTGRAVNQNPQPVQRDNVTVQSAQVQAQQAPSNIQPQPTNRVTNSIDRRNIEKLRREAIKKALGR